MYSAAEPINPKLMDKQNKVMCHFGHWEFGTWRRLGGEIN